MFFKKCGVYIARFLKYAWPFFSITHESINQQTIQCAKEFSADYLRISSELLEKYSFRKIHSEIYVCRTLSNIDDGASFARIVNC